MKPNLTCRIVILVVIFALCLGGALADSYTANTMRLLRYEGDVRIEDASGQPRFIMENARFDSGEAMVTGADGIASVGLDDSKIVTLDVNTRVEFAKSSNALKLTVSEGQLLLDVRQKLDENQTLDIQTSTMAVGIRGTIVYVREQPADAEAQIPGGTTLGVLEGVAEITYQDQAGAARTLAVPAGQKASLPDADGDGRPDDAPALSDITAEDIAGFVARQIAEDGRLIWRVEKASDLLERVADPALSLAADGQWTWREPVRLVAQSASKLYDGQPLTRPSDVLVYGLPSDFSISVSAGGSQTDAGEGENPVSRYAIFNAMSEDVTAHFTAIERVAGVLTVDPAPLTVWTGSAEKIYDGAPLTNPEALLRAVPGYEVDEPLWRDTACVVTDAADAQTLCGLCGSVWVHGTNPLTGETREIELRAGQRMTVYLSSEEGAQSIEFKIESLTEEELPEEVLRLYADNPDLLAQACLDTGWDPARIAGLISQLPEYRAATVRENGLTLPADAAERLMKDFTNVRITIDTEITSYDGRALGCEEARFTGVVIDDSILVSATGSQTEVGQSTNTYVIDWGGANPGNYILSEELGTLTVYPAPAGQPDNPAPVPPEEEPTDEQSYEIQTYGAPVTLSVPSASKVYDGQPLTGGDVTVEGLPEGFTASAVVEGSQTGAGSSQAVVTSYQIFDETGSDVTNLFDNVKAQSDTLTVEPLQVELNLGGEEIAYSKSYRPTLTLSYLNGSHAGESLTGELQSNGAGRAAGDTRDGRASIALTLFTGDRIDVSVSGFDGGAGTHTLEASCGFPGGGGENFSISLANTTLTVNPRALTVTTGSASKTYDGAPLTAPDATLSGLEAGDEITATATGSLTGVGTADNTYTIDWGGANPDNYAVTATLGVLEVTPNAAPIAVTAGSAGKTYDGTPLTCAEVTVEGLPAGFTLEATPAGTLTDAGSAANPIERYAILDAGGEDVTAFFTGVSTADGTLTVDPAPLTVDTPSASKPYDGTPLTGGAVTVNGLADGDPVVVTATGSLTEVGTAENTCAIEWNGVNPGNYILTETHGTLEVTKNGAKITVTAGSASRAYNGQDLTDDSFTVEGLPDGFTLTATTDGSQFIAGTTDNVITGHTIFNAEGKDRTANFTNVVYANGTLEVTLKNIAFFSWPAVYTYDGRYHSSTVPGLVRIQFASVDNVQWSDIAFSWDHYRDVGTHPGSFTASFVNNEKELSKKYAIIYEGPDGSEPFSFVRITPASLKVTTVSASKVYDGTPLKGEVTLTGRVGGDTITVSTETSITDVSSVTNDSYTIDWGSTNPDNYDLTEEFGTLTITPATLTVVTESDTKTYDGTPLTAGAHLEGLSPHDDATVKATGSITDAGSTINTYEIDWGTTNPDNYKIVERLGQLSVTEGEPAPLTVITESASKTYDGTPLTAGARLVGLSKYADATVKATGAISYAGSTINTYEIDWGSTDPNDYVITEKLGTLTVTKAPLKAITESATKAYDGTALTAPARLEGLIGSDAATITATGSVKNAGSAANTYTIDWGSANPDNYDITEELGTLTVTRATLTIQTYDDWKEYDGTPLTCDEYYISGLASGETVTIKVTGTITEIGWTQNTYELIWGTANPDNYIVKEYLGWLEVYDPSAEPIDEPILSVSLFNEQSGDTAQSEPEMAEDIAPTYVSLPAPEPEPEPDAGAES